MRVLKHAVSHARASTGRLARRHLTALASDQPNGSGKPALPPARASLATETFDWRDPLALSASLTDEESTLPAARTAASAGPSRSLTPVPGASGRCGLRDGEVLRTAGAPAEHRRGEPRRPLRPRDHAPVRPDGPARHDGARRVWRRRRRLRRLRALRAGSGAGQTPTLLNVQWGAIARSPHIVITPWAGSRWTSGYRQP